MTLQNLIANDYEAFAYYSANRQVVLLHPKSRLRSMLVTHLLNNPPKPLYYYAMGPNDANLHSFLDGFTHDMAVQFPIFGRHLFEVWDKDGVKQDMNTLVKAFCMDLAELSEEPFMLILDEFDATSETDEVQGFWELVVHQLPDHCQLVINGRSEPRMPWVSMTACGQAVILRDSDILRGDFYRHNVLPNAMELRTYGFGPGFVQHDQGEVGEWEGHLPRLLYFFILDRPLVTRAEICSTFWPDLTEDQAVNVFHVTKRRLHKALGFDALVHLDGYYQINPEIKIDYDVERFASALIQAREAETLSDGGAFWQEAADLYKAPFLQGHTEDWIMQRRADFLTGYIEAMRALAQIRIEENRPEQALNILNRALGEHETSQALHRDVMQLYLDMGRRSEAAGHYQKLANSLKDRNLKPENETSELYEAILNS